jgi:hypothetical protein
VGAEDAQIKRMERGGRAAGPSRLFLSDRLALLEQLQVDNNRYFVHGLTQGVH